MVTDDVEDNDDVTDEVVLSDVVSVVVVGVVKGQKSSRPTQQILAASTSHDASQ